MSLFRRVLNLDEPESPDLPVAPDAPLPTGLVGDTDSVRLISAQLESLPPARARYVAAFAYILGRAANATGATSDAERGEMLRLAESVGLDEEHGTLIVNMAATLSDEFGATEDFLVAREFK